MEGILGGYEPNGYRVWNVEAEKRVTVRDVTVDETNLLICGLWSGLKELL